MFGWIRNELRSEWDSLYLQVYHSLFRTDKRTEGSKFNDWRIMHQVGPKDRGCRVDFPSSYTNLFCETKMSCCGEEDDEILEQLIPSEIPNKLIENLGTCDDCDIISPMNSNFSALFSVDIVRSIFEQLSSSDLARAACVCRLWNLIASSREMHVAVFKAPWKLKHVIGNPTSNNFWRDNGIGRFAISHRIVRGDTVASLAVKYAVQVMDIKRLNNMLSDHGIHSRERLLIPVTSPSLLINATCYIELDTYAKREVAVIYLDGGNSTGKITISNTGIISQRNRRRILESVKRGMQVDECTAEYYLSISNGDPRAAFSEYSDDLRWDQQESSP